MSDDYDDYDERPPVPTFSDGSYSNKGAKSSAYASRLSASKNAHAVASRASVMMMASMQQMKNTNVPIVNSRSALAPKPLINRSVIQAAEKRAQHMIHHMPIDTPVFNTIIAPKEVEPDRHVPIYVAPEPIQHVEVKVKHTSEVYGESVTIALSKKKLLLETYQATPHKKSKKNTRVTLVQTSTSEQSEIDPSLLSMLSVNLLNIINSGSHNQKLIDEFNTYNLRARISLEEILHKSVVEKARIIKNTYFTSDT